MNADRSQWVWVLVLLAGLGALAGRSAWTGAGSVYVERVTIQAQVEQGPLPEGAPREWVRYVATPARLRSQPNVEWSPARTIGVWIAAVLTLSCFSFLYGDNPLIKLTQSIVIGSAAGFTLVTNFWTTIIPNLYGKLLPAQARASFLPGIPAEQQTDWLAIIPLILCGLLLMRLSPRAGWVSRWPLAFFIGVTAGLQMVRIFKADFIDQINNTLVPLIVLTEGQLNYKATLRNIIVVLGVLSSLMYFFFSVEHTGWMGRISKIGIGVLMITFGASFGNTVMSRITILSQRLQFLFDDWLWIIDPLGNRGDMGIDA